MLATSLSPRDIKRAHTQRTRIYTEKIQNNTHLILNLLSLRVIGTSPDPAVDGETTVFERVVTRHRDGQHLMHARRIENDETVSKRFHTSSVVDKDQFSTGEPIGVKIVDVREFAQFARWTIVVVFQIEITVTAASHLTLESRVVHYEIGMP